MSQDGDHHMLLPPGDVSSKPAPYELVLYRPMHVDQRFLSHALRIIWMKLHTADYLEAQRRQGDPAFRDPSQAKALSEVVRLCRKGSLSFKFPCRDTADTKRAEIEGQDVFGRCLPVLIRRL